ncbi:hypothetical protein [Rathayibacter soli]|uniref:hypothetical protein n=1 Tax=Rathayibacter soli TaxID=3144168 RepID=UPI0027E4D976|nr:hypothetical protein [Glaciibacter superstes]
MNEPTKPDSDVDDVDQSVAGGSIVVGPDGSSGAAEPPFVALELAEALKAPLVIARSWSNDTAPKAPEEEFGYVSSFVEITAVVDSELRADARAAVEAHPSVVTEYRVALGQLAEMLIRTAARARTTRSAGQDLRLWRVPHADRIIV